jgi:hypothetical protein
MLRPGYRVGLCPHGQWLVSRRSLPGLSGTLCQGLAEVRRRALPLPAALPARSLQERQSEYHQACASRARDSPPVCGSTHDQSTGTGSEKQPLTGAATPSPPPPARMPPSNPTTGRFTIPGKQATAGAN